MKRLCYICEATAGGVRTQLRLLMRHFSSPQQGYEVQALLGDRGEPGFAAECEELRSRGVRISILPSLQRSLLPWRDARAYREIQRALRALQPEIVHTHSSKAGFLGRLAAHRLRIPRVIHTAHVFPFQWSRGPAAGCYLLLERFAARRCQVLVCVSKGQRADVLSHRLAAPERLVLIPNGVDLPAPAEPAHLESLRRSWNLSPQDLVVGMVARLAPQKGVGTFLQAAAWALRERSNLHFVLVGGGPLEVQVQARAQALGLGPDRLRLLGHVEAAQQLYPAFDLLALSSLYEGLPYVLLEAMAWGVPVVATDVLGSREVVLDGLTGLLSQPGDPADLARKMLTLAADPELRRRLGAAARARVREHFSLARFLASHEQLYLGKLP